MKVKNIFSNRKNKKKKNAQQTVSNEDVSTNNTDKLIITSDGNTSGKENEQLNVSTNHFSDAVVLRSKVNRGSLKNNDQNELELTKTRASSTSSNTSAKTKSRRPWSFIDQLRRQDSRESAYSTSSSAGTSHQIEDLTGLSVTPPDQETILSQETSSYNRQHRNSGACTLPRSLTPEHFEQDSKTGRSGNAYTDDHHSNKRRTMDFRFFNFFKRSSSGETSAQSEGLPPNPGRSSFRGKNKGKKKGGGKKKKSDLKSDDEARQRALSDGGETSNTIMYDDETQIPPPGLYDSTTQLNSVDECIEPGLEMDKRVPVNGEPIFYLDDDVVDSTTILARPNNSSRKYLRRSDPLTGAHSLLKSQTSDTSGLNLVRSTSGSTDTSSRRSSYACEPRDSPLPEDAIASFDSSAYLGARVKRLNSSGSVPQISSKLQVARTLSTDIPKETQKFSVQARYSQSVSNLAMGSSNQVTASIPRSSSDTDKTNQTRRLPKPSPHQKKQDENNALRLSAGSTSAEMIQPPPSPVLRVIGYPGVVLRRNKHKQNKQRPNSAYADERTKHVLSLNMEDLPTYTKMRHEMTRSGANISPSYEDILAVQEAASSTKRGSSGVQYAGTASSRARRRGATMSNYGQRSSVGFAVAASAEDLESLSSSNYGSKQSLSDLSRMDDDERSNALLARSLAVTHTSSGNLRVQEPSSKRAKAIRKSVVSLANLISPGKPNQKNSNKLQRSSSFKEGSVVSSSSSTATVASFKPYRPPSNTPNKAKNNRRSKLWCESFDFTGLNEKEIKWQEAIFELYQGERDLVQDLTMAKQTYRDSMVTLKMLSDEEVTLIFGKLGCLLPLHEELLEKLEQARGGDGRTLTIAYIFVEWFPRISTAYREYCANQSDAKYALDAAVERDARVRDFLQRCLESPFSRKLDLWSYLDLPRTRLVKYPLLLQNVLKRTPVTMEDERSQLERVMSIIGEIIERVDETTGEQQCSYIRSKLEYLDDKQRSSFVDNSRLMLCSGQLKNNRGTKMHVFLFEEAFLLTRQTTRSNKISYQVYRSPLPLRSLVVDTNEGDKLSGSFRGGILSSEKVKHSFRVRSEELNITYTLQASEEHDRKQWINAIIDALSKYKAKHPEAVETQLQNSRRRATYDPTSNSGKKHAARAAVLRSSSDKSNRSVASSTEQSLQEESLEEDSSIASEDVGPWSRTRSQTVNPSILSSKSGSSVSRKSSGSSTKSDKSFKDKESRKEIDTKKLKERLRRLDGEGDGPPSPLRDSFKKKSGISRHFSLSGADKHSKPMVKVRSGSNAEAEEKARNKCQRSRSLTSSPLNVKSVGLFGRRRTSNLVVPNSAKPPIPTASPYSIRRSPSLKTGGIHAAQSTPNLAAAVGRSTSFSTRRSSSRLAQLTAQNNSNSVGNLRKGLAGSTSDLRGSSVEKRAEEARFLRRVRSDDKTSSEGDKGEPVIAMLPRTNSESTDESSQIDDISESITSTSDFKEPEPISTPMARMAIEIVCTPATPKETLEDQHNDTSDIIETENVDEEILTITSTESAELENSSSATEQVSMAITANDVTDSDVMITDNRTVDENVVSNTDTISKDNTETSEQMHCDEVTDIANEVSDDVTESDDGTASFYVDTEGDLVQPNNCETLGTKTSENAVSDPEVEKCDDVMETQSVDDVMEPQSVDDVMDTQSVDDVKDNMIGNSMLVRSTEDLLMEYCDETPPVHTPEGILISFTYDVKEDESKNEMIEKEEKVCESDVAAEEDSLDADSANKDNQNEDVQEYIEGKPIDAEIGSQDTDVDAEEESPIKDNQNTNKDVQETVQNKNFDEGVISPDVEVVTEEDSENKEDQDNDEDVPKIIDEKDFDAVLEDFADDNKTEESDSEKDSSNVQDTECEQTLVNQEDDDTENPTKEKSNVCDVQEEGVDSATTDEGIVRDGGSSEDTNSDLDNNNVAQVDDTVEKSLKDVDTDEQSLLKHESDTCCRNEISDESINNQHHNIQASV